MKFLILNGSPRKNGDCAALLAEFKKRLPGEWQQINTYETKVSPCVDCRACSKKYGCVIQDGMQEFYHMIEEADGILLASPLYFSTLSGSLLAFASRFQMMFQGRRAGIAPPAKKKKWGALVLSGGGSTCDAGPAINTAKIILAEAGAAWMGEVISLHTDQIPAQEDQAAFEAVEKLAEKLRRFD